MRLNGKNNNSMYTKKNYILIAILLPFLIFFSSCEEVEIAYPGNNQNNDPANPVGSMRWEIISEEGVGQLPENLQGTNTIIGIIDVDDENPDDEIKSVVIQSQKVNGNIVEFFNVIQDSIGIWKVVLKPSGNIDYETVHTQNGSSTLAELVMEITDDSPSKSKGTLSSTVLITNINESPSWVSTNVPTTADEGIPYESSEINWTDVDLDDSHTLSSNNLPVWLSLNVNKLSGTPLTEHVNANTSFTLLLQDRGGLEITKSFSINVRPNSAPSISGSVEQTWEEERSTSWTINWSDNNNVDYSTMSATVSSNLPSELTFTPNQNGRSASVSGILPTSFVNQTVSFDVAINDNRNGNPLSDSKTFSITVDPNDAPIFSNVDGIVQSVHHGCQYYYDVNWNDPDGDNIFFEWVESITWLNVNSSGQITGTPSESDIGSSGDLTLTITDSRPNVPLTTNYTYSISVDENFAPVFENIESIDSTATVAQMYSFQFAIADGNNDDITFEVPVMPNWLSYNPQTYTISGTPNSINIGQNLVTVRASDCGSTTSINFNIDVSLGL